MSEPVTIWERVDHEYPDETGKTVRFAAYRTMGEKGTRSIGDWVVDGIRRAKHLTEAELVAEYWASHGEAIRYMTGNPELLFSRRNTLRRFASHDQAV